MAYPQLKLEEKIKEVPNCMAREIVSRGMTEDELRKQYNFTKYAE